MRAKTIKLPTFDELYDLAPQEIKDYIDKLEYALQSPHWHPEGNSLIHVKIVYNRARKYGDLNLLISALFHDLGKATKTKLNNKGGWSAIGHELVSADLVQKHKDWITSLGADYDVVHSIVFNHMKIKQMDEMRPIKQLMFKKHPQYDNLVKFSEFDNMKTLTPDELAG